MNQTRIFTFFLVFLFITYCTHRASYGHEIEAKSAIKVLKNLEKEIRGFRWRCTTSDMVFSIPVKIENTTRKQLDTEDCSELLYSLQDKKYYVSSRQILQWVDGADPYIAQKKILSYDGKIFTTWSQSKPGKSFPLKDDASTGIVSDTAGDSSDHLEFQRNGGVSVGIGTGIPLFFHALYNTTGDGEKPKKLSEFIELWEQKKLLVTINDTEGIWTITVKTIYNEVSVKIVITFDLNKGGIVTHAVFSYFDRQGKEIIDCEHIVETKQNDKGTWVPTKLCIVSAPNKLLLIREFDDFEINPLFGEDSFRFVFPDNTYVDDYIDKKYYRVGDIVDHDMAIDQFIKRNNLSRENIPRLASGNIIRMVLMSTGLILLIAWAIIVVVKRLKRRS